MSPAIFLIGAGASIDAGMPLVAQLTAELKSCLQDVRDINGQQHPEFLELFDALAEYEPTIRANYERFFDWLSFLDRGQRYPFKEAINFNLEQRLLDAIPHLRWGIKQPFVEILQSRHKSDAYQPDYFARLGDFIPGRGRLKVFTTNFDLCIEDACRSHGIEVATGFQSDNGRWNPATFQRSVSGINLYKLHGSLNWSFNDNPSDQFLFEQYPPEWNNEPELLLGPAPKLQYDDPFVTLYAEFHHAVGAAKALILIGHGLRDGHISEPIRRASSQGMAVVEINPSPCGLHFDRHIRIEMGAKEALESGKVLEPLQRILIA
jgi:SIR2-like domain